MKQKISEQAKMNSSDWSGPQEDSDGFTQVLSKSSMKRLRMKQKQQAEGGSPGPVSFRQSRSGSAPYMQSRAGSRAARSRSHSRGSDAVSEEEVPLNPAGEAEEQVVDPESDTPVKEKEKKRRSRSSSNTPEDAVVPETPLSKQKSSGKQSGKTRVIQVNAADGMTLEDHLEEISGNGVASEPRDVDPSSKLPNPSGIRQVAEMLIEDESTAPPLKLDMPSTKRREAALQRLRRTLDCNLMQAE